MSRYMSAIIGEGFDGAAYDWPSSEAESVPGPADVLKRRVAERFDR